MSKSVRQFFAAIYDKRIAAAMQAVYDQINPVGSSVTQATNRTTGVTVTSLRGVITTNNASLAAEAAAAFVVTCPKVKVGDLVLVCQRSGAVGAMTSVDVVAVADGSFTLSVRNGNVAAGTAETGAIILEYMVIKHRDNS